MEADEALGAMSLTPMLKHVLTIAVIAASAVRPAAGTPSREHRLQLLGTFTTAELEATLLARRTPPAPSPRRGAVAKGKDGFEPLNVGNLKYLSYYECCTSDKGQYNTSVESPCPSADDPHPSSVAGGLHGNEAGLNLGLAQSLPAILKAHRCFGKSSLFQIDGAHGLFGKLPGVFNFTYPPKYEVI